MTHTHIIIYNLQHWWGRTPKSAELACSIGLQGHLASVARPFLCWRGQQPTFLKANGCEMVWRSLFHNWIRTVQIATPQLVAAIQTCFAVSCSAIQPIRPRPSVDHPQNGHVILDHCDMVDSFPNYLFTILRSLPPSAAAPSSEFWGEWRAARVPLFDLAADDLQPQINAFSCSMLVMIGHAMLASMYTKCIPTFLLKSIVGKSLKAIRKKKTLAK